MQNSDVWRFDDPNFKQLTFDMPVRSTRLMLDAALTVATWKKSSVYAIAGIGNAWNQIGYHDSDNGSSGSGCPDQGLRLNNNNQSNFVWEVGAGLSYALSHRFDLSLEYLYTDLGRVRTSTSGNTGTITTPVLSGASFKLKAQQALLGLHVAL